MNGTDFVKHDAKKAPADLLPPLALLKVSEVLGFGLAKYARHNWVLCPSRDRYVAAAIRHLLQYQAGEDIDPDSGLPHLAHAACDVLFVLEMVLRGWGADERMRGPELREGADRGS